MLESRLKKRIKFLLILWAFLNGSPAFAEKLPIPDGVYLSAHSCEEYFNNELDFLDFTVEKSGYEYTLPEAYCLPFKVQNLRTNRYLVEADCLEFGEAWQNTFMLDIVDEKTIRKDGQTFNFCGSKAQSLENFNKQSNEQAKGECAHNDFTKLLEKAHRLSKSNDQAMSNDQKRAVDCAAKLQPQIDDADQEERKYLYDLTEADRTYINRGHSYAEAICLNAVIDEIDAYGGVESMKEFSINLDDGNPTQIANHKAKIIHTCKDGKHVMKEPSGTYTLQIYDVYGNPTLQTN